LLALCCAVRSVASTSILMAKIFSNVLLLRTTGPLTVRAAARLVGLQLQIGKVRQHERGALHAMDPRLSACVVPFVARVERGLSALRKWTRTSYVGADVRSLRLTFTCVLF
jgi:hypothetical protein